MVAAVWHMKSPLRPSLGDRCWCALKGVDSRTQEIVSKWIQLLHKHPAHLHALDMKDAQKQRDPGIKPLEGITTSKLADKYIIKRNKIRNQITLLRGHVETGVVFFLDKIGETIRACDNLLLIWTIHGTPLGDRKVKETMYRTVIKILEVIEQWRENKSTEETLNSLTSIETFLEEINGMNLDILKEEEDAATELPSLLKLLSKKITVSGNSSLIRKWWYEVMTLRPPPLPQNSETRRENILDRVEEGWQDENWVTTMPKLIYTLLQENPTSTRNLPPARVSHAAKGVQWVRMEELGTPSGERIAT